MKTVLLTALITMAASSAFAYVPYGSNMGYYYPAYSGYLSYSPTNEEVGEYLDDVEQYVKNCDADIELIIQKRDQAIQDAKMKLNYL